MSTMVEEFEARGEKIAELEASMEQAGNEAAALMSENADLLEKVELLESEKAAMAQAHVEEKSQMQEIFEANREKISEQAEKIEDLQASLDQAHATLSLAPHADATDGDDAVTEDGGEGEGQVDHVEEMKKLHGAEAIAYYREHRKEIDANF